MKNVALLQLKKQIMPDYDFINRWALTLRPAEAAILAALVGNTVVNFSQLASYRNNRNAYFVHICRLRKKLPKGVKIKSEWYGVYSMTPESKAVLKKYERT